jgi:hypothetical protein
MHAKNRVLGGERPVELLAEDRYEEVRGAAEALIDGSYVSVLTTRSQPRRDES